MLYNHYTRESWSVTERNCVDLTSDDHTPSPPGSGMEVRDIPNDGFAAVVPDSCELPWDFWRRTAERLKATAVPSAFDVAAVPRAMRRMMRFGTIGCRSEMSIHVREGQ